MSDFQHTKTYPPTKRRNWPWVIAILAASTFCLIGSCTAYVATTDGDPAALTDTTSPGRAVGSEAAKAAKSAAPKAKPPAKPAPRKSIAGDDVVHVGEDVASGTYRVVEPVAGGDLCYWKKSSDAEGDNIIDNDIPSGGRPQVTLKKGQWFTSQGCPEWVAK